MHYKKESPKAKERRFPTAEIYILPLYAPSFHTYKSDMPLNFFNPYQEIDQSKNRLPHWQQVGAVYFVTWRLADSIPKDVLDNYFEDMENWLRHHPKPWDGRTEAAHHKLFSAKLDTLMDKGVGECLLRKPSNASYVSGALEFFEGERTSVLSYVVMPNHIHSLFILHDDYRLDQIVHSWKRHTALEINRAENRSGSLWQKDYFDRLVRDRDHFNNCVRYIRRNPEKAGLKQDEFLLFESDIAKKVPIRK